MPLFMWFYLAGLAGALAIGFVVYFVVGNWAAPWFEALFGERGSHVWGRSFRMMIVTCALIGGLSTQWHGCGGYADYEHLEKDPRAMFQKSTEQVSGAISYSSGFLMFSAAMTAIAFAFLWRGRSVTANQKADELNQPVPKTSIR